ncbi:hypothetical protein GGX14DRAFT_693344 [Mycena pura]|uniref:Fungal-type protein kinase domain-containing protein n=1 Tax=Mycena pura TaxID=153505 RepID=A0AAD6YST8_9AGAR|nr:hypothetical protein GGX14DRAFT_693344 [Mycena pura]
MSNSSSRPEGHKRHGIRRIVPKAPMENQIASDLRYNTAEDTPSITCEILHRLEAELHDARFLSPDLVDDVFGSFLPPSVVSCIVEVFLEKGLLRAYKLSSTSTDPIPPALYAEAAAKAEYDACQVGCYEKLRGRKQKEGFRWEWNLGPKASLKSESGAAYALNTIGTQAFEVLYGLSPRVLGSRWPQWRFARPPQPTYPSPLPDPDEQVDQRPDGCVLPIIAWENLPEDLPEPCPDRQFTDEETKDPDEYGPIEEEEEEEGDDYHAVASHKPTLSHEKDESAGLAWNHYQASPSHGSVLDEAFANWSQTRTVLELKHPDLYSAIRQIHLYLRTLRRAQPFLVSALGIVLTRKRLCLVRADSAGCEECPFDLSSSRGVLDFIRVVLGCMVADNSDLGPDAKSSKKQKIQKTYWQRCIHTITQNNMTYEVTNIIANNSSIRGRGTLVLKVRASGSSESEYLAMKVTWVDSHSESKERDWLVRARKAEVEHVLLPGPNDSWVSGLSTGQLRGDPGGLTFSGVETREETFCLTPYKLALPHFRSVSDFVHGLICILKGMKSLFEKLGLLHADISFGNIMFDKPDGDSPTDAWLIDLDNACLATTEPETLARPSPRRSAPEQQPFVTGTCPFMAVEVMNGAPRRLRHDVESVFYLMFFFFMTFNGPGTEDSIPHGNPWPYRIRQWTNGSDLATMGSNKSGYFSIPTVVQRNLQEDLQPHWRPSETSNVISDLIYGAYRLLWNVEPGFAYPAMGNRTPEAFIKYLENWLTEDRNLPF